MVFGEGVYKSTDAGGSWTAANTGFSSLEVGTLAIDPANPSTLYAGIFDGLTLPGALYKSVDAGASWSALQIGAAEGVLDLAVDPDDSATLYAGTLDGLWKSTDGGASWTDLGFRRAIKVAVDPTDTEVVYVYGDFGFLIPGALHRSTDGGVTWQGFEDGIPSSTGLDELLVDAGGTVYAATSRGVYQRPAGVGAWSASNSGLIATFAFRLAIDVRNPATVYVAALSDGLFKSVDAGASWTNVSPDSDDSFRGVVVDPLSSETVYGLTLADNVLRSLDGGASWDLFNTGLGDVFVETLAISPSGVLYAGTRTEGVFRRAPSDAAWDRVAQGMGAVEITILKVSLSDPDVIYANGRDGVFRSGDGGASWQVVGSGLSRPLAALAVDPVDSDVVYGGGSTALGGGTLRSVDGGQNWDVLHFAFPTSLVVDPTDPAVIYTGTSAPRGLWRSKDGGGSWERFENGLTTELIVTLAMAPGSALYTGTQRSGVFSIEPVPTSFGDLVWNDANANGRQDAGEEGLAGVIVDLFDGHGLRIRSLLTGEDGSYLFEDLVPGDYSVRFTAPAGFVFSPPDAGADAADSDVDPATGRTPLLAVAAGDENTSVDAGLFAAEKSVLALQNGRFTVEVDWRDFQGESGSGLVVLVPGAGDPVDLRSEDSAVIEFFGANNWEMLVKVLDGRRVNDHFWVFLAAATNVAYTTTVTDTSCGTLRRYENPLGVSASAVTDTEAFVPCADPAPPSCVASPEVLCLGEDGRFQLEVEWRDFRGATGPGRQVRIPTSGFAGSRDSGLLYFFGGNNWELLVKVLDGCAQTDHFWVFSAATTNVEYTLRVTDTVGGVTKSYFNPLGVSAPALSDTGAFATCDFN